MRIKIHGFLAKNHSWSVCHQNIARAFIKSGHKVDLFSTNGNTLIPDDLKNNLIGYLDENSRKLTGVYPPDEYDCQISYTAMKNFSNYLNNGSKNRFGIWCYEFSSKNALPDGFAKHYKYTDKILPPSQFAKQVFVDSGVPENHMVVVPHGIDFVQVENAIPYQFKTKKKTKILTVVAQIHRRKNLAGMLEMYGRAFNKNDDVCLILKVQDRKPTQPFELDFNIIFGAFKEKFKSHAEIEVIREFIPNIYSLYKSCDIIFSASHCEGFGITALDAHALGKINVASNYGGFLDFLNTDNSLLIEGKEFTVPSNFLYWSAKNYTKAFMPDIESGVQQLQYAVKNKEILLSKYQSNINYAKNNYNWDTIANQIIGLTDG
jgi:glycosyltransferase involved in cell wall biosynthesis